MATFTTETVTTTVHRWIVPAPQPFGAAAAEVGKAWRAAEQQYRGIHGLTETEPLADDALRFHVRDDFAVVIGFETETPAP